jgi:lysozyme
MIEELTAQLRRDEGEVLHAYPDHLGFLTIGIGRLIDERKGGGISPDEASYLLANDIRTKTAGVLAALPWAAQLDEVRRGVLIAMAFQMGLNGLLGFKTTLALVQGGNYTRAAEGMGASRWAKQTPARAARLQKQMVTGVWQ